MVFRVNISHVGAGGPGPAGVRAGGVRGHGGSVAAASGVPLEASAGVLQQRGAHGGATASVGG